MKVLFRSLALFCAALYLWVGGALFWHEHSHSEQDECSHHLHGEEHPHDANTCSICFFIHTGSVDVPGTDISYEISERDVFISLNDRIYIDYKHVFTSLKANKGPPVFS